MSNVEVEGEGRRKKGKKKKLKKSPKQAWGLTDIEATRNVAVFIRMTARNVE